MDSQQAEFLDMSMELDGSALFHSKMPNGDVVTTRAPRELLPVIFLTLQSQAAASIDEALLDTQKLRRSVDAAAGGRPSESDDHHGAPVLALMAQLSNGTLIKLRTEIEAVLTKRAEFNHVN